MSNPSIPPVIHNAEQKLVTITTNETAQFVNDEVRFRAGVGFAFFALMFQFCALRSDFYVEALVADEATILQSA